MIEGFSTIIFRKFLYCSINDNFTHVIKPDMQKILRITSVLYLFLILVSESPAQRTEPPFLKYLNHPWVDSVLNSMTTEEQCAQLIWVAAYSNRDISHEVYLSDLMRKTGIGGLVFFQDDAARQAEMTNYFRRVSKVPQLIALDGEWGIGMRLRDVVQFPYQMTLGAINDDSLIYRMGAAVAEQFRRVGANINLAPVADVNNNPVNPVINYRSFGSDPQNVARKTYMYMKGMQDNGIIAVAKHFPGHGDTDTDSHYTLPVIKHSKDRLDSVELVPFRKLIENGISSVMPGHLEIPALDSAKGRPVTLSEAVLTDLLRNELGFKGLTISDAMNMGGITRYEEPGKAELTALLSGMDVLEYVTDPELAISKVMEGITKGEISREQISSKCRKVLAAKYWAGLDKAKEVKTGNITNELSPATTIALIRQLYASALTVINNTDTLIPVKNLESNRIATLVVGRNEKSLFQERISKYTHTDNYFIEDPGDAASDNILEKLKDYDIVITGIFGTRQAASSDFGIKPGLNELIAKLNTQNRTIVTYFGNPYAVNKLESIQLSDGLIIAYQENDFTEDLSAQLIFGGIGASGTLPVTINDEYPAGSGITTPGNMRLRYGIPESAAISSAFLDHKIDSLANSGIAAGAYPGCEIMVAIKGNVIFNKTYGYQTYDNRIKVSENDLYDLASVTKITGPAAGLMLLSSEGRFSPDAKLVDYLPEFRRSNKSDMVIRDMLAHQAGLTAWIPFWQETVKPNGKFRNRTFKHEESKKYPLKVADGLYIYRNYRNKIFREIKKSPVGDKKYLYSDLTFILMPEIITRLSGSEWYDFVIDSIFHKLGAYNITFNPYTSFTLSSIVPTEYDSLFRKQQLHGTVHDKGAAMLGGISGHAGLFSTANDLMKVMELYRRMGSYGGEQLISNNILKEYTSVQFPDNDNRRGLCFDKPLLDNAELDRDDSYPTKSATPESFGHSGYTGPFVWIDPVYDLTYVFLCNRVYPTRNNNLLTSMNIRTNILQSIYDSIDR